VYFLNNFVLCLHKVELLSFLNNTHKGGKYGGVLCVASFLVLANLGEEVDLAFNLFGKIVFEILIFGFFVEFFHLGLHNHPV